MKIRKHIEVSNGYGYKFTYTPRSYFTFFLFNIILTYWTADPYQVLTTFHGSSAVRSTFRSSLYGAMIVFLAFSAALWNLCHIENNE